MKAIESVRLAEFIASNLDRLFGGREFGPATQDYKLADAILAAGYSKPRTITTVEELDALPVGSLVREDDGFSRYKYATGWVLCVPDATAQESGDKLVLPATVLHEPSES